MFVNVYYVGVFWPYFGLFPLHVFIVLDLICYKSY